MRDLTVLLDMVVGRTADILEDADRAGIPVVAGCIFPRLGGRIAHVAIAEEDVDRFSAIVTRHAASIADDRPCVVVPPRFPGGPAGAARALADAGVVVNLAYLGVEGQIVMAISDPTAAEAALALREGQ